MTTFLLFTFCVIKTVGSWGCPELKHVTEQRPVPQTHGNWQSFPPVYVQCWHSVQKARLQLVYSLRLLPYRDLPQSFFPLSPAINNKGVFGTPEHACVSVLSSLSQSGFQNQAMLGTVENVPEILLKSLLHFYFFCVGSTCGGGGEGTCGARRTTFRASCSFSTWVPGIELSLAWLQVTSLPIEALNF